MIDHRRGQKEKTAPCLLHPIPLLMLTILMSLSMAVLPENAVSKDLKTIISEIQKRYDSIHTLKIDFSQELTLQSKENRLEASGNALFMKPGMMRWEYISPEEQEIVSDGNTLWIYQPSFNQVMVSELPKEKNVARDFLSGMVRLDKDFVIEMPEESEDVYILSLKPKISQAGPNRLLMKINKGSSMVQEITNFDLLGNTTIIKLKNIKINIHVSPDRFTFKIPEGVKVLKPEGYRQ